MTKIQRWFPSLITAVALAGTASLCPAQSLISYTFDSGVQGFGPNGAAPVDWNSTNGLGGGGCLQLTIDGTTFTEADPTVDVAVNTAQYLSVSFDLMIDPTSGTSGSGNYGNLQAVLRDSGWSWDSMWYGGVDSSFVGTYKHVTFVLQRVSGVYKTQAHLQIQLSPSGNSTPIIAYIDNIKINPLPNPWVLDAFTSDTSSSYSQEGWTGISSTSSLNASQDAGGGLTPAGALQMDVAFPVAAQWAAWGQSWVLKQVSMDPSRYTFFECDVKVDAANSTPFSDGSYGPLKISVRDGSWSNHDINSITMDSSYTSWQHVKLPLPTGLTSSVGFDIEEYGNYMGPIRLYMDNIKLSNPTTLPKVGGLVAAGPAGTKITLNGPGSQWDRESICVPAGTATSVNYSWGGQTPATYSFSITNFPTPADAPGFEGHIFITTGDSGYDETAGSPDWNAANLAVIRVENGTNGGVVTSFEWKTNLPNANPDHLVICRLPSLTSANGTWALNFSDDSHGSIVGPNGAVVTNFVLDADMMSYFTGPSASFVQVGAFKNDGPNAGKSDNKGFILTSVLMTNVNGTLFDDDFATGLTNNYAWRVTSASAITSIPQGTAYWLKWGLPDIGFTPQSTASLPGGWDDAGITYIYTDATGTNRFGAVPAVSLPVGNTAFFRLINTNTP